jgi:hypothetical protein
MILGLNIFLILVGLIILTAVAGMICVVIDVYRMKKELQANPIDTEPDPNEELPEGVKRIELTPQQAYELQTKGVTQISGLGPVYDEEVIEKNTAKPTS